MSGQVPAGDGLHTAGALSEPKALNGAAPSITIDNDIPIPRSRGGGRYGGTGLLETLRILEVGQSFVAPNPRGMILARVQSDANQSIKRLRPKKFVTRTVTEN